MLPEISFPFSRSGGRAGGGSVGEGAGGGGSWCAATNKFLSFPTPERGNQISFLNLFPALHLFQFSTAIKSDDEIKSIRAHVGLRSTKQEVKINILSVNGRVKSTAHSLRPLPSPFPLA